MQKTKNHIIFWIVYVILRYSLTIPVFYQTRSLQHIFVVQGLICIQHIILFYIGIKVVFTFKSILKKTILLISLIAITSMMYALSIKGIYYLTSNILHREGNTVFLSWFVIGIDNAFGSIFLIFLFFYLNNYLILQQQKRAIQQQQATLNQTILDAELMGLKNQINPHFIYNTLNFMYAQALGSSQELSKSIILLSEIMYYNIKEFDDKNHIPLSIEIKHIQNIIQLQNIKCSDYLNILLSISGNPEFRRIRHLSIAIFIENAIDFVIKRKNSKNIVFNINVNEDVLTLSINFELKQSITIKEKQHIFKEAQNKLKEIYHNRATCLFNNTKLNSIQYTTTIKL